jgi:hypothetical protein
MNIGFDLDGVFIDKPPFVPKIIIEGLYRKHANSILVYRYPSHIEQFIRKVSHHQLFRPRIEKNLAFLRKHTHKSYQWYLISSRFSFLRKETGKIIKAYGLREYFTKMIFNFDDYQPHIFKDTIIKKRNIHMYVDDDLPLLEFLVKRNPKTIFFWLNKSKKRKLENNLFSITALDSIFY